VCAKAIKEKAKEAIDKLSERRVKLILDFIEYLNEKEEWEAQKSFYRIKTSWKPIEKLKRI